MKKFFLNLLSSFMEAWIARLLFSVVVIIVIVGMAARLGGDDGKPTKLNAGSVLVLDLKGPIMETQETMDFDLMSIVTGEMDSEPKYLNVLINEGARVLKRTPCQARMTPLAVSFE